MSKNNFFSRLVLILFVFEVCLFFCLFLFDSCDYFWLYVLVFVNGAAGLVVGFFNFWRNYYK